MEKVGIHNNPFNLFTNPEKIIFIRRDGQKFLQPVIFRSLFVFRFKKFKNLLTKAEYYYADRGKDCFVIIVSADKVPYQEKNIFRIYFIREIFIRIIKWKDFSIKLKVLPGKCLPYPRFRYNILKVTNKITTEYFPFLFG